MCVYAFYVWMCVLALNVDVCAFIVCGCVCAHIVCVNVDTHLNNLGCQSLLTVPNLSTAEEKAAATV